MKTNTLKTTGTTLALGLLALGLAAASASAASMRAWVSHSGADVAPCSRNAPCATFQFALTQTLPGGTITAINAGDYGPMTITQAVTVDGEGTQANITLPAPSGFNSPTAAVQITAQPNDVVTLRGLSLSGTPGSGTLGSGIFLQTGHLVVDDCRVQNFGHFDLSLNGSGTAQAQKTTISGGQAGVFCNMTGPASLSDMTVQGCALEGIALNAGRLDVKNSLIQGCGRTGIAAANGSVSASGCTLSGNALAVSSGGSGIVRLTNNDIWNNGTALNSGSGSFSGIISTTGNNRRAGNANTTTPIAATDQPNRQIAVQ